MTNLFPILPIPQGRKGPVLKNWQAMEPEALAVELSRQNGCNRGLRLDHYASLDPDTKAAQDLMGQWLREGILTPTIAWRTASGAERWLYLRPPDLAGPLTIQAINFQLRTGNGLQDVIPPSYIKDPEKGIDGFYVWLPDQDPESIEPAPLPAAVLEYFKTHSIKNTLVSTRGGGGSDFKNDFKPGVLNFTQGHRDASLFTVANALTKQGMAEADIAEVLINLAKNCNPPFPEKELRSKILSAERRKIGRERSIAEEVREWCLTSNGFFLTSELFRELDLTSRDFKKAATLELLRLKNSGTLEACGTKRGCYRLVEKDADELKWWEADIDLPFSVALPFDLHQQVNIFPRNIVIVAGATNAGKTAFLLNCALQNMNHAKVHYFTSEMPLEEIKLRLSLFEEVNLVTNIDEWRKVIFKERVHNFHQVIDPDAINVIDYLELTDQFYKVAEDINAIYEKLNKGIAIIGLQKEKGAEFGIGGKFTAFRSRLYIALDNGQLKVVKAKNWTKHVLENPVGKVYPFKLWKGAKFIITGQR